MRDVPTSKSIRRSGLIQFLFGLLIFVPILLLLVYLSNYTNALIILLALTLPGAYALAGLLQAATGVRFSEIAGRWDSLKGWQRGVFGTFIVLVALVVIVSVVGLIATRLQ